MLNKIIDGLGSLILVLLLVCFLGVIVALPTMLVWNMLMPEIFNLTTIDFWQALGLIVLANVLFKPFSFNSK